MKNKIVKLNSQMEIKNKGLKALKKALGPAGTARFIQQYEKGSGDYSKEKYQHSGLTLEDIDRILTNGTATVKRTASVG